MRSTTLDNESTKALAYLQSLLIDGSAVNPHKVEKFIDHIKFNPQLITHSDNALDSPVLVAFVPLVERLLRAQPHECYADLLLALLRPLPLNDIFKFFPRDQIVAAARLELPLEVAIATRIVDNVGKRHTQEAYHFVLLLEFMAAAVERMLRDRNIPTETVEKLEGLMQVAVHPTEFQWEQWRFLRVRGAAPDNHWTLGADATVVGQPDAQLDAQLAARQFEVVHAVVSEAKNLPVSFVTELCAFDIDSLFDLSDVLEDDSTGIAKGVDWFLPAVVIDSYTRLVGIVPFECIRAPVERCIVQLARRHALNLRTLFVESHLEELLGALSQNSATKQAVRAYVEQYPELIQLDFQYKSDMSAFLLLSLDVIADKEAFFDHHFCGCRLADMPRGKFECFLWLISNEEFFRLCQRYLLNDEAVKSLSTLSVFELLNSLASYDYSTRVLVSNLPQSVEDYLAVYSPMYTFPGVCDLQKITLSKLLFERKVDLGDWHDRFTYVLDKIKTGGNGRGPQVQVESNFA